MTAVRVDVRVVVDAIECFGGTGRIEFLGTLAISLIPINKIEKFDKRK